MAEISKAPLLDHLKEFIAIDPTEEETILECHEAKFYPRKSLLLQKGIISRHEFYILKGCLRVYMIDMSGTEHTLSLNIENWWCGDLKSFINETPASYYIQALEDTQVLQISLANWNKLLEKVPKMEKRFRLSFQNALIAQNDRIIQNISMTAEERYLQYLEKYPHILQRVAQKHVASYLGMTPEFFSILRRKMVGR
ncbi:MAG: Crp/Fnr family transcriptional regulator [Roseivirga sp.]|nr:Crp/Fnr family transcriptional regulator [Roseivirga sp.]